MNEQQQPENNEMNPSSSQNYADGLTRIYLYNQQTVTSRVRKEKQDWEQLKERKKKEVV